MTRRKIELDPKKRPDYVARGSEAHAALLGLAGGGLQGTDQAAREEALAATKPQPTADPTKKIPITRENYDKGESILDGWSRLT